MEAQTFEVKTSMSTLDVCAPLFKNTSRYEQMFSELTDELYADALGLLPKPVCEQMFSELTNELYRELLPVKQTASRLLNEKPRKPVLRALSRKKEENTSMNETSRYLCDSRATRWSEWQEKLVSYTLRKKLAGYGKDKDSLREEAQDMVLSFLVWVCANDMLKGRTHEQVMYHWVQSTMYVQWVTRTREKEGQDALSRHRNKKCRTQQERKVGEFHITSDSACSEVVEKNEETGQVQTSDLWDSQATNEAETDLMEESINTAVHQALEVRASNEEEASLWKRAWGVIYAQKDPHRKMYETDQAWAEDWGMPVAKVRRLKERVRNILASAEELQTF